MSTHALIPFQSSVIAKKFAVTVEIEREDWQIRLHYRVKGPASELTIPERDLNPSYEDGLYHHTCLEFFVMGKSKPYLEFNFSPSHDWAVFAFDSYRKRSDKVDIKKICHTVDYEILSKDSLDLAVAIDLSSFQRFLGLSKQSSLRLGVSAVLESREGELSYWALWQPEDKPDFHRDENFAIIL